MPVAVPVLSTPAADSAFNVTVTWAAVASATGYNVYYSTQSSNPVKNGTGVTAVNLGNVLTTTINLPANAGVATYFSVSAIVGGVEGSASAGKSAIPKGPPGAFPSDPTVSYSATGQPILTWSAPATVGYSGVLSYTVQDSSDSGVTWISASTTATSPYTFTGRVAGVTYVSRVVARNTQSLTSTSNQVSGTPYTVPGAPQSVSATLSTTSATQATVSFRAPASNGSNAIQRYTVTPSTAPTAAQSFSDASANLVNDGLGNLSVTVSGLNLNTTYTFSVKAVNAAGSGTPAATASIKTKTLHKAPTAVVATPSGTSVSVSFTPPVFSGDTFDITGYTVTPYANGVAGTPVIDTQSPISVTGLSPNVSYTFKVAANSLAGTGTQSSASAALVLPIVASAPSGASYSQPSGSTYANATIQYSALALSDATVVQVSPGVWTVSAGGQTDTLTNIKTIQCTDRNALIVDAAAGTYGSRLSSAVAAARSVGSNGDTIFVGSGSFIETTTVSINKSVTVQGPISGDPAIIGSTVTMWNLYVICHNVTINNITLDYSYQSATATVGQYPLMVSYSTSQLPPGDSASNPSGIVQRINNFACNNVVFTNPFTKGTDSTGSLAASQRGVALNGVNNATFDHCTFPKAFNFGLALSSCSNVTVTNSTFYPCGWGAVGIFPSSVANSADYSTSNINLSDSNNVFNTMSPISVQPVGAAEAVALPTQAVVLMQPNSGATGASNYPFTCGTDGTTDIKLPASMDYLYISDSAVQRVSAATIYAASARYLPAHQYLESSILSANWYGQQLSTGNFLVENRFNVAAVLASPYIDRPVIEFQLEADIPTDSQLLANTSNSGAVIISDDQGRSYIYNSNIVQALAKVSAGAPFDNLAIAPGAIASGSPSEPISVRTASAAPYTISSDEYVASASSLPNVRSQTLYVQSSADQSALLTSPELAIKNKPHAPTINSVTPGSNSLTVDWTDNAGGSPTLQFNVTANGSTVNSVTSPYTITGLTNGTQYSVVVDAVNSYGDATASSSGIAGSVPGAPSEYDQQIGDGSLTVIWSAPANNGGSDITGYTVYWSHVNSNNGLGGGLVADGSTIVMPTPDGNGRYSHTITGLANGTAYEWSVSATNASGEGDQSSRFQLATPIGVPSQPLNVSATASDGQVIVSWSPPETNGGAAVTGYTVSVVGGSSHAVSASPYTVTGLTNGTSYLFTVTATNSVGNSQPSVPSNSVIPSGLPDAPSDVALAPGGAGTSGTIILNWTGGSDNGTIINSYNVYQTVDGEQTLIAYIDPPLTTTTLTDLIDGTDYTFQVAAVNDNGEGNLSAPSATITPYQLVTLSLSNLNQTYTGSVRQATATSSPAGAPISLSYDGGDRIEPGLYLVTASVTGKAFQADNVSDNLVISKANVTISLSNLTQEYTGSALVPTVTTTPSGVATSITYNGSNVNPGSCSFTVNIVNSNYTGSEDGTLTIQTTTDSNANNAIQNQDLSTSAGVNAAAAAAGSAVGASAAASGAVAAAATAAGVATGIMTRVASAATPGIPVTPSSYIAPLSTMLTNIASVTVSSGLNIIGQNAVIGSAVSAAVAKLTDNLGTNQAALAVVATKNRVKVDATPNALANADALVRGLEAAFPQGNTFQYSGADATTLLANTNATSIPADVIASIADANKILSLGDPSPAYYLQLEADITYTLHTLNGQNIPLLYDAANKQFITPGDNAVHSVGDVVNFGFSSFKVSGTGSILLTDGTNVVLQNLVAVRSGTSVTVSWTVPNLSGLALDSVNINPVVNGVHQGDQVFSQTISSPLTSYTLSGLSVNDQVSFIGTMVDRDGVVSDSATSNTVTIPSSNTVPCFLKGTLIATPSGNKAVETLQQGELVLLADGRQTTLKLYGRRLDTTTERSAPYFIPKHALGKNMPAADLTLSPDHAFLLRKGVWMLPRKAAELSSKVKQLGVGEPVHYFHVECPNYLRDNLVVNGCTVESYAGKQLDFASPYTWSESLKGYTRMSVTEEKAVTKTKASRA